MKTLPTRQSQFEWPLFRYSYSQVKVKCRNIRKLATFVIASESSTYDFVEDYFDLNLELGPNRFSGSRIHNIGSAHKGSTICALSAALRMKIIARVHHHAKTLQRSNLKLGHKIKCIQ